MKKKTSINIEENVWTDFRKLCLDEKKEAGIYLEELIKKELSKKGKKKTDKFKSERNIKNANK